MSALATSRTLSQIIPLLRSRICHQHLNICKPLSWTTRSRFVASKSCGFLAQVDGYDLNSFKLSPCFVMSVRFKSKDKVKSKNPKKIVMSDEEMMQVIDVEEMRLRMKAVVEKLKEDYIKALNVRPGVGMEDLLVEFDDSKFPLKELASMSRKANNLIVLNLAALPDAIKPVIKTLTDSGMNVNIQQDGTMVYVTLPKITREHRESLVKSAKMLFQKSKEMLNKIQNEYQKEAKEKQEFGGMSADLVFNVNACIKTITDEVISDCESLLTSKTNELLQTS